MIKIYTDGSCKTNPGPGGWSALILFPNYNMTVWGYDPATTNNRMELKAAIEALRAVGSTRQTIQLYSDSQYLIRGITLWLPNWKGKMGKAYPNKDLWTQLEGLASVHDIDWQWVRGHSGDRFNELVDMLAKGASVGWLEQVTGKWPGDETMEVLLENLKS